MKKIFSYLSSLFSTESESPVSMNKEVKKQSENVEFRIVNNDMQYATSDNKSIARIKIADRARTAQDGFKKAIEFEFGDIDLSLVRSISFNLFAGCSARAEFHLDFTNWSTCFGVAPTVTKALGNLDYFNVFIDLPDGLSPNTEDCINSSPDQVTVDIAATNDDKVERTLICGHTELHVFEAIIVLSNNTEVDLGEDRFLERSCVWHEGKLQL